MKIGFSLGRCVRDIANGKVTVDEVAFLITATLVKSRGQLEQVVEMYAYEPRYLLGVDIEKAKEVAGQLWDSNKIIQPRAQGMGRHMQPESSIWVDIFPTELSDNETVKKSWDAYRFMLHMTENVDNEATEVFR